MFCRYCGKNSGDSDICSECLKKINDFMAEENNRNNINISGQTNAVNEKYYSDRPLGFRTNKPWKMVISSVYYLYGLYCIIHMYNTGEGWLDAFTVFIGFAFPVDIADKATNKGSRVNKWLEDKSCFMKFLWVVCYTVFALIAAAVMIRIAEAIYYR